MKKILFLIVFISCSFAAFSRNGGGLLLQLGVGGSNISYGNIIDDVYDSIDDLSGDRLSIYLDGLVGFSVSDKTYLTLSLSANHDSAEVSNFYESFTATTFSYLIAVGFRTFPTRTGFYIGADVGLANGSYEEEHKLYGDSQSFEMSPDDNGFGGSIKLGYDFDTNHRGPSLSLAGALTYLKFGEDTSFPETEVMSASLFVTLNFR